MMTMSCASNISASRLASCQRAFHSNQSLRPKSRGLSPLGVFGVFGRRPPSRESEPKARSPGTQEIRCDPRMEALFAYTGGGEIIVLRMGKNPPQGSKLQVSKPMFRASSVWS